MDWADRIGRRVRLRDLHVVLAVAESGSMAKAAAHLSSRELLGRSEPGAVRQAA